MRKLLFALAVVALTIGLVVAVAPLREACGYALHGNVHALRHQLRSLGATGAIVLVALILAHAVLFFPAEIVNAAAGLVYGFGIALPLVMASWLASGLLAYWLGASAGRPIAVRLAGGPRVDRAERLIARAGVPALIVARLIPFLPYSFVGYAAGAARVPLWRYSWTTVVGILPITASATYLGHSLDRMSASDPLMWLAVAVISVLMAGGLIGARRFSRV